MAPVSKDVKDILLAAADLLEKPGGWTKGACARDSDRNSVPIESRDTVCFCTLGALSHLTLGGAGDAADDLFARTAERLRSYLGREITRWNDAPTRTQTEVVRTLRGAAQVEG